MSGRSILRLPRLLRDASWISLALSAPEVVRGLVFLALAPLLGPEAYGVMGLAAVVIAVAVLLLRDGWATALAGRHELSNELLSSCFWALTVLAVAMLAPIAGGGWLLGRLFEDPSLPPVVAALAPAMVAEALGTPARVWLLRNDRSRDVALASATAALLAGLGAAGGALAGWGVWSLVLFNLLLSSVTTALLWRRSEWRPDRTFAWSTIRPIVAFAAKVSGGSAVIVMEQVALRSFVAAIFGTAGLGSLMLARRVVELVAGASSMALGRASLIGLARDPVGSGGRRRTLLQAMLLGLLVAAPLALALALGGETAVLRLAGPAWQESAPLLRTSALLVLILPVNAVLAQWHFGHDRAGLELALRFLGTLLLLAFLPLVFVAGLNGVVLAMAARAWTLAGCRLYLVFRRGGALGTHRGRLFRTAYRPRI